jgi:hypothetical protein
LCLQYQHDKLQHNQPHEVRMNYYAKGGQAHGLKSLAQELPKYGRYGDDVVAHISSDEARMLQAMGGSGTINPVTGLPEFFKIPGTNINLNPVKIVQSGVKAIQNAPGISSISKAATDVFQPIEKAIVQPIGQGFASLDKMVGSSIPGGWGTVASVAGSAMGLPTPALVGLGALTGSGVMRKGGSFNLQGALIGGATAYASAKLGEYARAAAPGAEAGATNMAMLPESAVDLSSGVNAATGEIGSGLAGNASGMLVDPSTLTSAHTAGLNSLSAPLEAGLRAAPPPSVTSQLLSGNFGDAMSQVGTNIGDAASRAYTNVGEGISNLGTKATDAYKAAIDPNTYTNFGAERLADLEQTGAGIKNLITGPAGVGKAAEALSGVNPVQMGGVALYGASSLAALDEQRDFLKQQLAAGNMAQAEYDAAVAEIDRSIAIARESVAKNPINIDLPTDISPGDTLYGRGDAYKTLYGKENQKATVYAMGGSVDDSYGMDEARGLFSGNMSNGFMNMGSTPAYAKGGMPRFLSGGGDGMSDDIPAVIGNKQPARLADGEFVIPADVVSHLGNGSSKAGAKQLYSMMDKVRSARTGNSKQGKQINPRKYMPA